jgi:hypothetical protein
MRCFGMDELVKAELGDLTVNEVGSLRDHVASCGRCAAAQREVQQLLTDLSCPPELASADSFVERVMAARPAGQSVSRAKASGRSVWSSPLHGMLAAAALVLVVAGVTKVVLEHQQKKETWTARGGAGKPPLHAPAAEVMVMRAGQLLPLSGQSLSSADAFAVRYTNPARQPQYLAAFAVDTAGAVHWIYPEYADEKSDPHAVPLLRAEQEQLLPQVVEPDNPAPGPMHVAVVISGESLSVKRIEATLKDAARGGPLASVLSGAFPHALIREWSCAWQRR